MPRTPVMDEGVWERLNMRGWRQQCCHCGLTHDWQFKVVNGELYGRVKVCKRATAAARRALKKRVLIVDG